MTVSDQARVTALVAHLGRFVDDCKRTESARTRRTDQAADFERLRWSLLRGVFADQPEMICRPMSLQDLEPLSWLRVDRLETPAEGVYAPLSDALAALAMSRVPVVIVISDGEDGGLHLGFRDQDTALGRWVRSVLAPGTLLSGSPAPSALRDFTRLSNGVAFTTVPGGGSEPLAPGVPGLARIMLAPPGGWALLLRLDPVTFDQTREVEDALTRCAMALARFGTVSDSTASERSVTIEQPEAQGLSEAVKAMLGHLNAAEAVGLWSVSVYTSARTEQLLEMITGAAGSLLRDERLAGNRWLAMRYVAADPRSSGAAGRPAPATLMSTDDVAQFLLPGPSSLPGLEVAPPPPAGRRQSVNPRPLALGRWVGTDREVTLDVQDLEGHAFVTGTTGMGKSTTVQKLLLGLANDQDLKFLIIDPVKADYEELAPALVHGLTVVDAADLALNVLQPYPGFPVRTHLELVANAFKGSFSMPSPVPYIVSQLFELMIDRAEIDPPPTLHDLRDLLDPFVVSLGYAGEIESNIRASLGLRLALLLAPAKAERMACPENVVLPSLFDRSTVVQLSSLGDDEERAFLMSVLTLYVAERARVAGRSGGQVRHVTVLEEAHRILPEPVSGGSSEEGDASSVAAKLLTQLLAEIRSYGEAVIVVDQSPATVARDVVRNTNLKIAHRLPDPQDRELVGGSLGLTDEQLPGLGRLQRGEVLVTTRRSPEPQTVAVTRPETPAGGPVEPAHPRIANEDDPRPCCQGRTPAVHHGAEALSREAESAMSLALTAMVSGARDWAEVWAGVDADLAVAIASEPLLAARPQDAGRCLAWIGLRRGLLRYAAFGRIPGHDLEDRLKQAFALWSRRRSDRPLRLGSSSPATPGAGPFYGCRWCQAVCRFRHLGEASTAVGRQAARGSLAPVWAPISGMETYKKLAFWMARTEQRLTPALGEDDARHATVCAVVQLAATGGMPREAQDRLLEPREST